MSKAKPAHVIVSNFFTLIFDDSIKLFLPIKIVSASLSPAYPVKIARSQRVSEERGSMRGR